MSSVGKRQILREEQRERSFQWKEMVTTAKIGVHRLMSLVVCLEAMLQNIQNQKPQGKPGKLG